MLCPFCQVDSQRIVFRHAIGNAKILALWDGFPVSPGHLLLVPSRHVATWFDASLEEQQALMAAIEIGKSHIEQSYKPNGYNIGINVGPAAGQTVPHLHVHLIPRYIGDVPDPRGGVRHVIPSLANYLAEQTPKYQLPTQTPANQNAETRALFTRGEFDPLLPHLKSSLDRTAQVDFSVAFIKQSGVDLLRGHLQDLLLRAGRVRIITGDYLDVTQPEALEDLLELGPNLELYVVECTEGISFHPKAYLFYNTNHPATGHSNTAYIGSSNISRMALQTGIEWNYRVDQAIHGQGFQAMAQAFEELLRDPRTRRVDHAWIDQYRARRRVQPEFRFDVEQDSSEPPPSPHQIQLEALEALGKTRLAGNRAGLVVLATGLGKTWLAAFDASRRKPENTFEFPRVLFVAHRDEILHQSMRTFRKIRPESSCARYDGSMSENQLDRIEMLFASVQTLGRVEHLRKFQPDAFDYIIIDEFHHAAATTYRRLIDHFEPKFLLGLTATPERTDGGDLLGLCQENLVYRCDLVRGIQEELLSPFEYYGVPDRVDYTNIPWRSRRFDEAALTSAVSTHARAQNALEQLQRVEAKRTIGFCCSQQHADFMAEYFRKAGMRVAAVHSGPESDPRSRSLEALERGELDIVFAVDMFNEGLDIPSIDTVLMLRPTESSILWLQQFGRGLRKSADKLRLKVVDYIGNHRTFLVKLRSMMQPLLKVGESDSEIRRGLEILKRGEAVLPEGCSVTYELETIELIEEILRPANQVDAMSAFYRDFKEQHDQRPTALEAYHAGYNPRAVRATHGSWYGYVRSMGGLGLEDQRVLEQAQEFMQVIESTSMTKSYKMLVLLAMLQLDRMPGSIRIEELCQAVRRIASRSSVLRADIGDKHLESDQRLRKHLESNPIQAWIGQASGRGKAYFEYEGEEFRWQGPSDIADRERFALLVRELVEWRLAEYLDRSGEQGGHRCRIISSGDRPIIKLPTRIRVENLPLGFVPIRIEHKDYIAKFAKEFINKIQETESSTEKVLGELLRRWYGPSVGQRGTRFEVLLMNNGDTWELVRLDP